MKSIIFFLCLLSVSGFEDCEHHVDYDEIEYQCGNPENQVVFHVKENSVTVECTGNGNWEKYAKNFAEIEKLHISQCAVNVPPNVTFLEIENSIIGTFDNLQFDRLILKSCQFFQFKNLKVNHLEIEDTPFDDQLIKLNLIELNLSFNRISHIPKLNDLIDLRLSNNEIKRIQNGDFNELKSLKVLTLDFNSIEDIHESSFNHLDQLNVLDLSFNNISIIKTTTFKYLKNLKYLLINFNPLKKIEDFAFSNLESLTSVSMTSCNITTLPENVFFNSNNLLTISLNDNKLINLPKELFHGLKKIEILHLEDNELTSIDNFDSVVNLNQLFLQNNKISVIDSNAFKNNVNLMRVDLSNNQYGGHVYSGPFSFTPNLEEIDLSRNKLTEIIEDLFIYPRKIKRINFNHNSIKKLELISFTQISNRNIIVDLEYNMIETIDVHFPNDDYDYDEEKLPPSTILLSNNPYKCDCHGYEFYKILKNNDLGLFFSVDNLRCAFPESLEGLKFESAPPEQFICPMNELIESNCTNLECGCYVRPMDNTVIVDCSNMGISTAPSISPLVLPYMSIELHLEDNRLRELPIEYRYYNISRLFLARNEIKELSWFFPDLEILDVRNNSLERMDESTMAVINASSMKGLYLGNNPWRCDCGAIYFANFVLQHSSKLDSNEIRCNGTDRLLTDTTFEDCEDLTIFIMTIISITMLCMSSLTLAFYYKNKEKIKIWLFTKNLCVMFEDPDEMKIYDAFVSYSNKDEEFVITNIVNRLEPEYKLCVHYRNWVPGETITEQINKSVSNSKRTLVVLTENFLSSIWGKMEFRLAHLQAMKEKRCRVILIVVGDLNLNQLDEELKAYVKTNTYLKWGDDYFFEKLRYALPRRTV